MRVEYIWIDVPNAVAANHEAKVELVQGLHNVRSVKLVKYALYGVDNAGTAGIPDDPAYVLSFPFQGGINIMTHTNVGGIFRGIPLFVPTAPFCSVVNDNELAQELIIDGQPSRASLEHFFVKLSPLPGSALTAPAVTRFSLLLRVQYDHD